MNFADFSSFSALKEQALAVQAAAAKKLEEAAANVGTGSLSELTEAVTNAAARTQQAVQAEASALVSDAQALRGGNAKATAEETAEAEATPDVSSMAREDLERLVGQLSAVQGQLKS